MRHYEARFNKSHEQTQEAIFNIFDHDLKTADYQRPYTWGRKNAQKVIKQIDEYLKNPEAITWQNLLLQKVENSESYLIGDGQQRITTITLALSALWHRARKLQKETSFTIADSVMGILPNGPEQNALLSSNVKIFHEELDEDGEPVYSVDSFRSRLSFHSPELTKELHKLLIPMSASELEELKISESKEPAERLKSNFKEFYNYFLSFNNEEFYENHEKIYDFFTHSVRPVATILNHDENMLKQYITLNTDPQILHHSEIAKALLHKYTDEHFGASVTQKLSTYWHKNLETGFFREDWRRKGVSRLDYAISMFLQSYDGRERVVAEIADDFQTLLEATPPSKFKKFIKHFKLAMEIFEQSLTMEPQEPGSKEWWSNYGHQIIGESGNNHEILAVFMNLERKLSEEDYIKAVKLIIKYHFNLMLILKSQTVVSKVILNSDSQLLQEELTYEAIEDYILYDQKLPSNYWRAAKFIKEAFESRSFSNYYNNTISELFIFTRGILSTNGEDLMNTRVCQGNITREHIIPQKPDNYALMEKEERYLHDELVGLIGNSIPLDKSGNSSVNNRSAQDKLTSKVYRNAQNHEFWGAWFKGLLNNHYQDFTSKNVEERTKLLSSLFSLAIEKPDSHMKKCPPSHALIDVFPSETLFSISNKVSKLKGIEFNTVILNKDNNFLCHGMLFSFTALRKELNLSGNATDSFKKYLNIEYPDGTRMTILKAELCNIDWRYPINSVYAILQKGRLIKPNGAQSIALNDYFIGLEESKSL